MNNRYQSPRLNATGLAIGSILALIVAMAISVAFDIQPVETSVDTTSASSAAPQA
jgi:hypothetical protein